MVISSSILRVREINESILVDVCYPLYLKGHHREERADVLDRERAEGAVIHVVYVVRVAAGGGHRGLPEQLSRPVVVKLEPGSSNVRKDIWACEKATALKAFHILGDNENRRTSE